MEKSNLVVSVPRSAQHYSIQKVHSIIQEVHRYIQEVRSYYIQFIISSYLLYYAESAH